MVGLIHIMTVSFTMTMMINCCPEERMMCYDQEILKEIVYYFCETGERNPRYNWIEDMFEVS